MEKKMENDMETGGNILFYLVLGGGGGPRRGPGLMGLWLPRCWLLSWHF